MKKSEANLNLLGKKIYYLWLDDKVVEDEDIQCPECKKKDMICRSADVKYVERWFIEEDMLFGFLLLGGQLCAEIDNMWGRDTIDLNNVFITKKEAQTECDKRNKKLKGRK